MAVGIGLLYGIGPGLVFAFWALMYNIVARFFGGLALGFDRRVLQSVDITPPEKPKRSLTEIEEQIRARRAKIAP